MINYAIEFFEGCLHDCGNPDFINLAIEAIREKLERENGCGFCDEKSDEHDYMNGVQSINGTKYLVLETSEWDGYYDCFKDVRIPVTYCPMCGKRLEVEP